MLTQETVLSSARATIRKGSPFASTLNFLPRWHEAGYGQAITLLLESCYKHLVQHPELQAPLDEIAKATLKTARTALAKSVQLMATEKDPTKLKGNRPADIYRAFAQPLRFLRQQEYLAAGTLLRDIMELQTLPYAELDNPDWIDGYTGEPDPEYDEEWGCPIPNQIVDLPTPEDDRLAVLGYSEADIRAFHKAQEGYNVVQDDDQDPFFDSLPDDRTPLWLEMQSDLAPTDHLERLQEDMQPYVTRCQDTIRELRAYYEQTTPKKKGYWTKVMEGVRASFTESAEAKDFLEALQEQAEQGAAEQDLAVIFLGLQHGYGFDEYDAAQIKLENHHRIFSKGHAISEGGTLYAWLQEFGDELLETLHDGSTRLTLTDSKKIDAFSRETLAKLIAKEIYNPQDVTTHPAFLEGYYRAAFDAKDLRVVKSDGVHNVAVEAGWENFRQVVSGAGNRAFHRARNDGMSLKDAMREFWKIKNLEDKRKAEAGIKKVTPSGLVLSNARKVDWKIAALKFKNHELDLTPEDTERLRDLLGAKGWGAEFFQQLSAS